jgi:hypothetical protein
VTYAVDTSVPVDRSKAEIERLLVRYGADHFASGWRGNLATVGFRIQERLVRFDLPLPSLDEKRFTHAPARYSYSRPRPRPAAAVQKLHAQAQRSAWRALALVIKAKLEAVESGITTFESEFLAHIVLPGGRTVGETISPEIAAAYAGGKAPRLLLAAGSES